MGGGAASVKRWFALHDDFVLYTFASETDSHALTATPMPGYTVLSGPELKGEPGVAERDRERTIKMFYAPLMTSPQTSLGAMAAACRKAYFFVGSSPVEVKRSDTCPPCVLSVLCPFFVAFENSVNNRYLSESLIQIDILSLLCRLALFCSSTSLCLWFWVFVTNHFYFIFVFNTFIF